VACENQKQKEILGWVRFAFVYKLVHCFCEILE
jgi:hypothetical protein